MKYRVLIEQDEDGVFVAQVPSLPGCISQGMTRGEALSNIQEAIDVYLESLKPSGLGVKATSLSSKLAGIGMKGRENGVKRPALRRKVPAWS
jgi:predicted RNase H-like HicB family nuclease